MQERKIRKTLSFLLASCMMLSLSACGSKVTSSNAENNGKNIDSSIEENDASSDKTSSGISESSSGSSGAAISGAGEKSSVYVDFTPTNSWDGEKGKYTQYDVTVYNNESEKITDWSLDAECPADMVVDQNWNTTVSVSGGKMNIIPADYAKAIEAGGKTEGLGIIVADSTGNPLSKYQISYSLEGASDQKTATGISGENSSDSIVTTENNSENSNVTNSTDSDSKEDTKVAVSNNTAKVTNTLSKLHVEGTSLMNEKGEAVRLQGISTLGLAWYPQYVNEETFKSFKDDWGINIIRLAMYTQEDGGYCVGDEANKKKLKGLIDKGVKAATDLGLYVIIDWHILSDGNPMTHEDEAEKFFDEMSRKYASYSNVLYEICNEPNGSNWKSQIKPYAEKIIPIIRKNAPDSVIIVGTNTWSQDVDDVISDPINEKNLMYTVHFYAATHKENIRNKAKKALDAGIPVFISECSICDASGNGGLDKASADEWKKFINENGLSFIEWSLSNKNESSAILVPSCKKTSGFTDSDYTDSAKYYRTWMRENAGL